MQIKGRGDCRKIGIESLCEMIKPGDRIFISSGSATPLRAVSLMMDSGYGNLFDLELVQLAILDGGSLIRGKNPHKCFWKTFNVGESIAYGASHGNVDSIPSNLAEIPYLFYSGALDVKVAIVQTSLPDSKGFVNLGIAADVADLVIRNAPLTVAEMNPRVPITYGETSVHVGQFDFCIESDRPLPERTVPVYDDITAKIGWHVANIIEDDSTVALHFGGVFDAVAHYLKPKKNLRICTYTVSDWIIGLIESGALATGRGIDHQGIVMTGYCLGSSRLYEYVNQNPFFTVVPMLRASYQSALPKIPRLTSIIDAASVDITGNAVTMNPDDYFLPGFEGKLSFSMASALSRRGKSIVTVRSCDDDGNSNIVLNHNPRQRVCSTLGTTRYVVSEYGVANVAGKSIRERTMAIIDIAHPNHRDFLIAQAKEAGYIYGDQIYYTRYAANYPFSLETVKTFGNNLEVKFRPIKPSDENMMRRLFYGSSAESKFMRYFMPVQIMPHIKMQLYVNIDYERIMSIVGTIQNEGMEKIIAEARYARDDKSGECEMAFIVDERYQGKGIASFLLNCLISIARNRGESKLSAVIMPQNDRMAKVFIASGMQPEVISSPEHVKFIFDLNRMDLKTVKPP